jgi:hypothetical protein
MTTRAKGLFIPPRLAPLFEEEYEHSTEGKSKGVVGGGMGKLK